MSQTSPYPTGTYETDPTATWNQKESPVPTIEEALETLKTLEWQLQDIRDTMGHREFDRQIDMGFNQRGPLAAIDQLSAELGKVLMMIEDGEW